MEPIHQIAPCEHRARGGAMRGLQPTQPVPALANKQQNKGDEGMADAVANPVPRGQRGAISHLQPMKGLARCRTSRREGGDATDGSNAPGEQGLGECVTPCANDGAIAPSRPVTARMATAGVKPMQVMPSREQPAGDEHCVTESRVASGLHPKGDDCRCVTDGRHVSQLLAYWERVKLKPLRPGPSTQAHNNDQRAGDCGDDTDETIARS